MTGRRRKTPSLMQQVSTTCLCFGSFNLSASVRRIVLFILRGCHYVNSQESRTTSMKRRRRRRRRRRNCLLCNPSYSVKKPCGCSFELHLLAALSGAECGGSGAKRISNDAHVAQGQRGFFLLLLLLLFFLFFRIALRNCHIHENASWGRRSLLSPDVKPLNL